MLTVGSLSPMQDERLLGYWAMPDGALVLWLLQKATQFHFGELILQSKK
jgi:hypothetical protein